MAAFHKQEIEKHEQSARRGSAKAAQIKSIFVHDRRDFIWTLIFMNSPPKDRMYDGICSVVWMGVGDAAFLCSLTSNSRKVRHSLDTQSRLFLRVYAFFTTMSNRGEN